jgi:triosephosphate isomerase
LERDAQGSYLALIAEQLTSALKGNKTTKLVIAYEPVWAIGKGANDAMKPHDLQEMVIFIRKTLVDLVGRAAALKVPIVYGGSVEASNARALLKEGGVAGFLVGHASADADAFSALLKTLV